MSRPTRIAPPSTAEVIDAARHLAETVRGYQLDASQITLLRAAGSSRIERPHLPGAIGHAVQVWVDTIYAGTRGRVRSAAQEFDGWLYVKGVRIAMMADAAARDACARHGGPAGTHRPCPCTAWCRECGATAPVDAAVSHARRCRHVRFTAEQIARGDALARRPVAGPGEMPDIRALRRAVKAAKKELQAALAVLDGATLREIAHEIRGELPQVSYVVLDEGYLGAAEDGWEVHELMDRHHRDVGTQISPGLLERLEELANIAAAAKTLPSWVEYHFSRRHDERSSVRLHVEPAIVAECDDHGGPVGSDPACSCTVLCPRCDARHPAGAPEIVIDAPRFFVCDAHDVGARIVDTPRPPFLG